MASLFGGKPFGAAPSSAPGGSSLFGGAASTSQPAQASGGLFGSAPSGTTGTTQASTTDSKPAATGFSSLFGGSTANTSQPQPASSLLGGNPAASNTAQPQAPSMFSALGNNRPAPAATSMFGGAPRQPQASTVTNNQPAASVNANSQSHTTGYFESLLAASKKQANGELPLEDLPSLQLGLGDLRQKLRKLGPKAQDPLQHGRAQYMLAGSGVDPGAAVKDLKFFNAQAGRPDATVPGAPAAEVDVETYLANLQAKTTLSMIADGLDRSVRDFDNFLEDNVTMEWDAQRKRIYEHFGIKLKDEGPGEANAGTFGKESQGGFGRSRRSKSSQSTPSGNKGSTFGRSTLQKSVIGTPSKIGSHKAAFSDIDSKAAGLASANGTGAIDDRFLREKEGKLAEKIRDLNIARVERRPYPILYELSQAESRSGDRHAHHIVDAYQALMDIIGENPEADTFANGATARERQFKKMYLDVNPNSPDSVAMRKRILAGASQFLEKKFFRELESEIAKYPREANLGGRPDVISKVKAYVRLRHQRKNLAPNSDLQEVGGEFVWAVIFYLLRSGHVTEAAEYVKSNSTAFRTIDRTFQLYLLEYASSPDRRLRRQVQDRCNNEYSQRARNAPAGSIDPFRMACYKIVGRCDVSNRNLDNLNTEVDDWVWLEFNLARESDRTIETASETFTLANLQEDIKNVGKHFPKNPSEDTNGTFGMYFFLQVLAGMFEHAIKYLYEFSYVDAIHFAIGLEFYGLLRPADPWTTPDNLLAYDIRQMPQLNFGRMLGFYTRDFRAADVGSAVEYLTLICLNQDLDGEAGQHQTELCHIALRELVLETREFSKLIGDIRPDGRRITGLIEDRRPLTGLREEESSGSQDRFVKTVTLQAARFADDNGRTTDAVLLYHLAEDYDSVVTIVSRALSEAISLEIGQDPMRLAPVKPRSTGKEPDAQPGSSLSLAAIDDPVDLAKAMMSMYEKDAMFYSKIDDQNRTACYILLKMSEIKAMVEAGQWPEALDAIRSLEILPLDANGDAGMVRNYASKFPGLSQPVAINVPNLLMWTITCCIRQRERLMSGVFSGNEGTRRLMCDNLKQISVDLTTYTSQLKYRFPPYLHEALARASAD